MSEQHDTTGLLTTIFQAWKAAGIDFVVLRNYERLPHLISNDVDVLVAPAQRRQAERVLLTAARQAGYRLHNRAEFATLAFYFSRPGSQHQAHLDLFTQLLWRGFEFLDCAEFLAKKVERGLFAIPHPAHEAATNLLATLIYTGKVKPKYHDSIAGGFRSAPEPAELLLAKTYGPDPARFLVSAGAREDWHSIEQQTGSLRRTLVLRQLLGRPWRTLKSLLCNLARIVRRLLQRPGMVVALCGPDGSGKSTAAQLLVQRLQNTFSPDKGACFHWKPRMFPGGSRSTPVDPHGRPPRPLLVSLLYFGYHWLEFWLGMTVRVAPRTFRGGLVIIDRFYYDFFVDPLRYRLQVPHGLVRLGHALLMKPDLCIVLDAPSEVLQTRKREVPAAETERQRQAYQELARWLPNGRLIDAGQAPDQVAADIAATALEFLATRISHRLGAGTVSLSQGNVTKVEHATPGALDQTPQ